MNDKILNTILKLLQIALFVFMILKTCDILNVQALEFTGSTAYFDYSTNPSAGGWTRSQNYMSCNGSSCTVLNQSLANAFNYWALDVAFVNQLTDEELLEISYDYHFAIDLSPSRNSYSIINDNNFNARIIPENVGGSTTCSSNFSQVLPPSGFDRQIVVNGHCRTTFGTPTKINSFIFSLNSNNHSSVPATITFANFQNQLIHIVVDSSSSISGVQIVTGKLDQGLNNINNNITNIDNSIKDTNKKIDDVNNTLNDDNVDSATNSANNFIMNFQENGHGLTSIVTSPLELIKSLSTGSCTPLKFNLPIVHNEVTLPCAKAIIEENYGVFFSLWQMITTGLISYHVLINMYCQVRKMQNPNHDKIEVINL